MDSDNATATATALIDDGSAIPAFTGGPMPLLEDAAPCVCGCPEDAHRIDGRCTECIGCLDFERGAF
jgi:hypothetical protein